MINKININANYLVDTHVLKVMKLIPASDNNESMVECDSLQGLMHIDMNHFLDQALEIHNTQSQHILMDMWLDQDITSELLNKIQDVVYGNYKVVNKIHQVFEPQGDTIVLVLSESHFTIHTYPEHKYLTMDLYICNMDVDVYQTYHQILDICKPLKNDVKYFVRGER